MDIALALGGGGVKGTAHIGVIDRLESFGFRIRAIAGTSAGGLMGAAYAAGLAVGYWSGLAGLKRNWAVDKRWRPAMPTVERDRLYRSWQKAVTRSFDWVDSGG